MLLRPVSDVGVTRVQVVVLLASGALLLTIHDVSVCQILVEHTEILDHLVDRHLSVAELGVLGLLSIEHGFALGLFVILGVEGRARLSVVELYDDLLGVWRQDTTKREEEATYMSISRSMLGLALAS